MKFFIHLRRATHMAGIVECVPNFSEGRDEGVIKAITDAAKVSGAFVLSSEPDADYNRTVLTIAGEPEAVSQAAFNVIQKASELIDMTEHQGEHPRIGAVDVCPFIPLDGMTMEHCAQMARDLAQRVHEELGVPTFTYGEAASDEARRILSDLRKGEYEGLESRLTGGETPHTDDTRMPDYHSGWNDTAKKSGATVIGARNVLVAYNVNVDEEDAASAKKAGSLVRSSGRLIKKEDGSRMRIPGMLPMVQGMGVTLESHGISQVSMNLRDVEQCPLHVAYEAVQSICADHDVSLKGSELVGLVPLSAMLESGRWYSSKETEDEEELVNAAIDGLGLSSLERFVPEQRIIEWAVRNAIEG